MDELNFTQMLEMQRQLWERYKDKWSPLEPYYARSSLLWMIGELGEVVDLIKKKGEEEIISNENVHSAFVEELCDVLMYYNDVLMRYNISPDEISSAYRSKHSKNMQRDFIKEHEEFLGCDVQR